MTGNYYFYLKIERGWWSSTMRREVLFTAIHQTYAYPFPRHCGFCCSLVLLLFNIMRPRQNGRYFSYIFKCIFFSESVWILLKISLRFVPNGPINNIPALVQIMAWHRQGDKPLSDPVVVGLLTLWASLGLYEFRLKWYSTFSCFLWKYITSFTWTSSTYIPYILSKYFCQPYKFLYEVYEIFQSHQLSPIHIDREKAPNILSGHWSNMSQFICYTARIWSDYLHKNNIYISAYSIFLVCSSFSCKCRLCVFWILSVSMNLDFHYLFCIIFPNTEYTVIIPCATGLNSLLDWWILCFPTVTVVATITWSQCLWSMMTVIWVLCMFSISW